MIYSSIKNTNNKDEILERILVYIRIVEVIAERNNALIPSAFMSEAIITELKDMGVIDTEEDLPALKTATKDLYARLINCVSFYLTNKKMYGNQLDKLSNKKREQIQSKIKKEHRPIFADFLQVLVV